MIILSRKNTTKDQGWSFIETIIVIAIILILIAGVAFYASQGIEQAKYTQAKLQIESLKTALQSYYIDCNCYPTTEQGLAALWEAPNYSPIPDNWNGPYLEKRLNKDPWGNNYLYYEPGAKSKSFLIISLGADGKEGGEKFNADIKSADK
jgi:general secretion pathway protein G